MSDHIPANQRLKRRDLFFSLALQPLEIITASLRRGDPWELTDLQQYMNRNRAMLAAFDDRMKEVEGQS